MSRSTDRRNRITLGLGAASVLAFSGLYGLIAGLAPSSTGSVATTDTSASVLDLNAVVATPTPAAQAALTVSNTSNGSTTAATPAPTVAPTPAPTTAATTTHAQTRGS